SPYFSEK
ncbi:hypothetical protein D047_2293B, partial [Vibrio parahaemolyticus VPTS-2010_2]